MATSEAIRVLLVDDQKSTVELLKSHLSGAANIDVVGTAYNGQEAIEQVQESNPMFCSSTSRCLALTGLRQCG